LSKGKNQQTINNQLKIAVNCRFLIEGKLEGIGTYTHEVLQRLVKLMPDCEFHFLFDRQPAPQFLYAKNVKAHVLAPQARHPFLWWWWFEVSVKQWLNSHPCDVFFSPDSFLSLRTQTPTLLIMHDIAFEHFNDHNSFAVRHYYRHFFPRYARKANHIMAVSEYTRQDIINTYGVAAEKIEVAYCGISDKYHPISEAEKEQCRQQYTHGAPYFISIGSINPRKNLDNVIRAFDLFKAATQTRHQLVIAGARGWKTGRVFDAFNHSAYRHDIILTGHIQPQELNTLLAGAEALVFPSLFEGFGIPIAEAFKAGVPVITSDISSMPEVAGNAALLVSPQDTKAIAQAMQQMLHPDTRQQLIQAGKERAAHFSWDTTARSISHRLQQLAGK
jgi:glycosyltransferase involved in cell wall biosynthesis